MHLKNVHVPTLSTSNRVKITLHDIDMRATLENILNRLVQVAAKN